MRKKTRPLVKKVIVHFQCHCIFSIFMGTTRHLSQEVSQNMAQKEGGLLESHVLPLPHQTFSEALQKLCHVGLGQSQHIGGGSTIQC